MYPASPALGGGGSGGGGGRGGSNAAGAPSSSRSVSAVGGSKKGWFGEKPRASLSGAGAAASGRPSFSSSASGTGLPRRASVNPTGGSREQQLPRAQSALSSSGGGVPRKSSADGNADGEQLSRAQIALNRHQARMDRIREKREERMGGKDASS